MEGFESDSGPQAMLIQLLPSSTVAAGVRLKIGFGTVASAIPGGTIYPSGFPGCDRASSGGTRAPLQYCLSTVGLALVLCWVAAPYPVPDETSVSTEYDGARMMGEPVVGLITVCWRGSVAPV